MALRMRQTTDAFEQAMHQEMAEDRAHREHLRRAAAKRSRARRREQERSRASLRFVVLVLTLLATAAGVTVAMFEILYAVLG